MWFATSRKEKKNHDHLSRWKKKKAFDKVQHTFMIETLIKLGTERPYLNIIKAIYDKLYDGKLKDSCWNQTGQECPLSPLLFNILLEVLATVVR